MKNGCAKFGLTVEQSHYKITKLDYPESELKSKWKCEPYHGQMNFLLYLAQNSIRRQFNLKS